MASWTTGLAAGWEGFQRARESEQQAMLRQLQIQQAERQAEDEAAFQSASLKMAGSGPAAPAQPAAPGVPAVSPAGPPSLVPGTPPSTPPVDPMGEATLGPIGEPVPGPEDAPKAAGLTSPLRRQSDVLATLTPKERVAMIATDRGRKMMQQMGVATDVDYDKKLKLETARTDHKKLYERGMELLRQGDLDRGYASIEQAWRVLGDVDENPTVHYSKADDVAKVRREYHTDPQRQPETRKFVQELNNRIYKYQKSRKVEDADAAFEWANNPPAGNKVAAKEAMDLIKQIDFMKIGTPEQQNLRSLIANKLAEAASSGRKIPDIYQALYNDPATRPVLYKAYEADLRTHTPNPQLERVLGVAADPKTRQEAALNRMRSKNLTIDSDEGWQAYKQAYGELHAIDKPTWSSTDQAELGRQLRDTRSSLTSLRRERLKLSESPGQEHRVKDLDQQISDEEARLTKIQNALSGMTQGVIPGAAPERPKNLPEVAAPPKRVNASNLVEQYKIKYEWAIRNGYSPELAKQAMDAKWGAKVKELGMQPQIDKIFQDMAGPAPQPGQPGYPPPPGGSTTQPTAPIEGPKNQTNAHANAVNIARQKYRQLLKTNKALAIQKIKEELMMQGFSEQPPSASTPRG